MATSNLYNVLSGLYSTDSKIYNKLTGYIKDNDSKLLSADNTTIVISSNKISVKDGGISIAKLSGDASTKLNNAANLSALQIAGSTLSPTAGVANIPLASGTTKGVVYGGKDVTITDGQITVLSANQVKHKFTVFGQSFDGSADKTVTSGAHIKINNGAISIETSGTYTAGSTGIVSGGLLYSSVSGKLDAPTAAGTNGQYIKFNGTTQIWDTLSLDDLSDKTSVLTGLTGTSPIYITGSNNTRTIAISGASVSNSGVVKLTDSVTSTSTDVPIASSVYSYVSGVQKTLDDKIGAISLSAVTTTSGYASTYQLYVNGSAVGAKIDIVRDQFLKTASLVYGSNKTGTTISNESATKSATAVYPWLKFVLYVNSNGSSSDDTSVATIYVPVDELFRDYTAGNYIDITSGNVISIPSGSKWSDAHTYVTAHSGTIVEAASNLTTGNLVVANGNKGLANLAITSGTLNTDLGYAVDWNTNKSTITGNINAISGKISGAFATTSGYIVLTKASNNGIQSSSILVGATTSGSFGAENEVARESSITGYLAGSNYVTGSNLSADYIVLGNGTTKIKSSGKSIVTSISSGSTDNEIATAKAVHTSDTNNRNYMLNGAASESTGVSDWSGSSDGSLTDILSKINTLNAAIN